MGGLNFPTPQNTNPVVRFDEGDAGANVFGCGMKIDFSNISIELFGATGSSDTSKTFTPAGGTTPFIAGPDGTSVVGLNGATNFFSTPISSILALSWDANYSGW